MKFLNMVMNLRVDGLEKAVGGAAEENHLSPQEREKVREQIVQTEVGAIVGTGSNGAWGSLPRRTGSNLSAPSTVRYREFS